MSPITIDDSNNSIMQIIADANNLHESFLLAKKGTDWKESVQRYEVNELKFILNAKKKIDKGYYPSKTKTFVLHERGHIRLIKPNAVEDRVVYKSFNRNVMLPNILPKLIYDNGASLKNKGISFARKRFEMHLRKAIKEYGEDGCVLFIDFSKYFDNIDHDIYKSQCSFLDSDGLQFLQNFLDSNIVDVSYMTDNEYAQGLSKPFNVLEHECAKHAEKGEKFYKRSLGIGSENSQTAGIFLPTRADNNIKIVRGIKHYGRYMDDAYTFFNNKEELQIIANEFEVLCLSLGIFVNKKKTHICKIKDGFTYLKINYIVKDGKIIRKIANSNIRRERVRLRKYYALMLKGNMSFEDILQCYRSWRGAYKKFDNGYKILRMDNYFSQIYSIDRRYIIDERKGKNRTGNKKSYRGPHKSCLSYRRLEEY